MSMESSFFERRGSLRHLYQVAEYTWSSPWALLAHAMLRALNLVPWKVHYETQMGQQPVNTCWALVGSTGAGKSSSEGVVDMYFRFPDSTPSMTDLQTWEGSVEAGSGEAIPDWYAESRPPKDEDDTTAENAIDNKRRYRGKNHAAVFHYDEVGKMNALNARQGSTLPEYIKSGFSGENLGRVLAGGHGTMLKKRTYRFGMSINMQPKRGGLLFNPDQIAGGLPGRFVFVDAKPLMPEGEGLTRPEIFVVPLVAWTDIGSIKATESMEAAHKGQKIRAAQGLVSDLDGHKTLVQAKVAIGLAVLDGRPYLDDEDWELAGMVMEHSDAVRGFVLKELSRARAEEANKAAEERGRTKLIKEEVAAQMRFEKVRNIILAKTIGIDDPKTVRGKIRKDLNSSARADFDTAWSSLFED
jgi:hypothetical protein